MPCTFFVSRGYRESQRNVVHRSPDQRSVKFSIIQILLLVTQD